MLPPSGEDEPVLPLVENGTLDYGTADMSRLRTCTVRAFDPGATEVTIDFVLHQHGAATTWSRSAKPGNVVGLNTPTGMYDAPAILRWQILVADRAGLPALARILEQTPPTVRTRVVVEVPDAAHQLPLSHHHADITWVHGGNGHRPSRIEEIVLQARPARNIGSETYGKRTGALGGVSLRNVSPAATCALALRVDPGLPS
jgi:NADPH-dependent ferric siderophore reductase